MISVNFNLFCWIYTFGLALLNISVGSESKQKIYHDKKSEKKLLKQKSIQENNPKYVKTMF